MKALLVIDMQRGSFTEATPRYEAAAVVDRINILSASCRRLGFAVIFIQHDGTHNGDFIPGTEEWQLLPDLVTAADLFVAKTANDCFYRSELASVLDRLGVRELYVSGCATDFCVDTTIKAALAMDYNVYALSDAHTTADRPGIAAAAVIAHYNWVWGNMLPTEGCLQVISTTEAEQRLQAGVS